MQRQKNRETNEVLLSENLENCLTGQCIASDDTQLYWEKLGCGATNSNPNNKTNVRDFCFLLLLSYKKRSSSLWKDKALNQDETLIFLFSQWVSSTLKTNALSLLSGISLTRIVSTNTSISWKTDNFKCSGNNVVTNNQSNAGFKVKEPFSAIENKGIDLFSEMIQVFRSKSKIDRQWQGFIFFLILPCQIPKNSNLSFLKQLNWETRRTVSRRVNRWISYEFFFELITKDTLLWFVKLDLCERKKMNCSTNFLIRFS